MSDDIIETEYELAEAVFVPDGDGAPAQWKPKGDLKLDEMRRHMDHRRAEVELHKHRLARYDELIEKGQRAATEPDTLMLDKADREEFLGLKRTLDAMGREIERRQAAIDADIAAGRCYRLPTRR